MLSGIIQETLSVSLSNDVTPVSSTHKDCHPHGRVKCSDTPCGYQVCGYQVCGYQVCGYQVCGYQVCGYQVCGYQVCGYQALILFSNSCVCILQVLSLRYDRRSRWCGKPLHMLFLPAVCSLTSTRDVTTCITRQEIQTQAVRDVR
jgi:hypothetical protein